MTKINAIREFVQSKILLNRDIGELKDDYPLIDAGLIDSIAVMRLIAFLQDEYDAKFEPDDLTPENFRSLKAITALIENKTSV